ncbi:MAG: hypothetical protein KDA61_08300, partial [Planctomycetales bacterium]|nr:hypothetical protein [Planctomycetales bacterium]
MNACKIRRHSAALLRIAAAMLIGVASCVPSWAQAPAAPKPMAVVAISGYDALMSDIDFLGSLGGMPGASQLVEMMLMQATQNQGLVGLNKDQPIGVVVQADASSGMFGGALCVPVSDLSKLLETLEPFGVSSQSLGQGLLQISGNGQNLFAKSGDGWAYLSIAPPMLENVPADPKATLGPLTEEYDIAVRLFVQNIPEMYRQQAVSALLSSAQQGMSRAPDESDEDFGARREIMNAQLESVKRLIQEVNELTIGISLDGQQQRAFADFALTALPNTKLSQDFALNANPTTNFAGFFQPDAALSVSFASKSSNSDAAQLDQVLGTLRTQALRGIEEESDIKSPEAKEAVKAALNDLLDAIASTVKAGVVDGGAIVNLAPDAMTLVAGGFVSEPKKVESALKRLVEVAEKEDSEFPGVKWNAASHGGVSFHTLSAPVKSSEEDARKLFGDTVEVAIGIGSDAVYFAAGRNNLDLVNQVIDQSKANRGKAIAPAEVTFSLSQILKFAAAMADDKDKPQISAIATMLDTEAAGRDHVRIISQPIPNG